MKKGTGKILAWTGIRLGRTVTRATAAVLGLALAAMLAAAPAGAGDNPDASRRDRVMGTVDEGMSFGRDPGTGDTVFQIGARPAPQSPAQPMVAPPVVVPEVTYTVPSRPGGVLVVPPAGR